MGYEISKIIADSGLGNILYGLGDAAQDTDGVLGFLGGPAGAILKVLGIAATNAPLIPIITSFFGLNSGGFSNGTLADIINSVGYGRDATAIFNALGSGAMRGGDVRFSGAGVSGGMYVSSGGVGDLLSGAKNSLADLAGSVVTIEADEGPTLEENVTTITETLTAVLDLLTERLESIDDNVYNLASSSGNVSASVTS